MNSKLTDIDEEEDKEAEWTVTPVVDTENKVERDQCLDNKIKGIFYNSVTNSSFIKREFLCESLSLSISSLCTLFPYSKCIMGELENENMIKNELLQPCKIFLKSTAHLILLVSYLLYQHTVLVYRDMFLLLSNAAEDGAIFHVSAYLKAP